MANLSANRNLDSERLRRFSDAVAAVDCLFVSNPARLADDNAARELRRWLDGDSAPLGWAGDSVTPDEWFFVTTLYGEMTRDGQRTHIRKFFPRFVAEMGRDIRSFSIDRMDDWKLRSPTWMKPRLCRMAEILRERELTMSDYAASLRELEKSATSDCPSPALDQIKSDHRATSWKTLSVFIRDCVGGNCFPIDTRVANELKQHGLPHGASDEELLTRLALAIGRNPRQVARMFYEAGGENAVFD